VFEAIQKANSSGEVDPARQAEALKDPEIRAIMSDPIVNQVLKELGPGGNKQRAQEAMSDASIVTKINKLIEAGILRVG